MGKNSKLDDQGFPVKPVRKTVSMAHISKSYDQLFYFVNGDADASELFKELIKKAEWTRQDKANLCRIASACESVRFQAISIRQILSKLAKDFLLVLEEPVKQIRERKKAEKKVDREKGK